jgi:hypothetical protein
MEAVLLFAGAAALTCVVLPRLLEPANIHKHDRIVNKIMKIEPIDTGNLNKKQTSNGRPYTPDLLLRDHLDPSAISANKTMDQLRRAVVEEVLNNQQEAMAWNLRHKQTIQSLAHKKDNKPVLVGSLTGNVSVKDFKK